MNDDHYLPWLDVHDVSYIYFLHVVLPQTVENRTTVRILRYATMLPWTRALTFKLARGYGAAIAANVAVAPNLPRTARLKCISRRAALVVCAHAAFGRAAGVAVVVGVQEAAKRAADLICFVPKRACGRKE